MKNFLNWYNINTIEDYLCDSEFAFFLNYIHYIKNALEIKGILTHLVYLAYN